MMFSNKSTQKRLLPDPAPKRRDGYDISRPEASIRIRAKAALYLDGINYNLERPIEDVVAELTFSLGRPVPEAAFDDVVLALAEVWEAHHGRHEDIDRNNSGTIDTTPEVIAQCEDKLNCAVGYLLDTLDITGQTILPKVA